MSTLSSGSVATRPRPSRPEAALRARLSVVPRRRTRAPRVPFVTLVSVLLVGGVVGLLCFNTQMQQASFASTILEERAANLSARQQTLEMELEKLRSPNQIAAAAQKAGLVPPASTALLSLETGEVTGEAAPAIADSSPPLQGRAPVKPAELSPAPNITYVPAPADQAALADAQAAAAIAAQAAADQAADRDRPAGERRTKKQQRAGR